MMNKTVLMLSVTFGLLVACAPIMMDSTANTPVAISDGQTVLVQKPGAVFVQSGFAQLVVPREKRNDEFDSVLSYDDIVPGKKVTSAVNWLLIRKVSAPNNWTVEIAKQIATREVISVTEQAGWKTYMAIDRVSPVLAIDVPAGTTEGEYPVKVSFESRFNTIPDVNVIIKFNAAKP